MASTATLVFCILTALYVLGAGRAVQIHINPRVYRGIDARSVNITCTPEVKDHEIKEVVVMEITKNGGKPLVLIRQNSQISYGTDTGTSFQAVGAVTSNVSQSYLSMTLKTPDSTDSGMYACVLYYLDESGILQETRASANLTVESVNELLDQVVAKMSVLDDFKRLKDSVKSLENAFHNTSHQMARLDHTTSALADAMSVLEKKIENVSKSDQCADLSQKVTECLDRVSRLEQISQNVTEAVNALDRQDIVTSHRLDALAGNQMRQAQEMESLVKTTSYTAAFSAAITDITSYNVGDTLVFPDVIMSHGQGYQNTTGVFVAPTEGLYAFHLTMSLDRHCQNCDLQIQIIKNGVQVLTTLSTVGSTSYTDRFHHGGPQSSASTIVHLDAGYNVSNVLVTALHSARLDTRSVHASIFTGYLVRAL